MLVTRRIAGRLVTLANGDLPRPGLRLATEKLSPTERARYRG